MVIEFVLSLPRATAEVGHIASLVHIFLFSILQVAATTVIATEETIVIDVRTDVMAGRVADARSMVLSSPTCLVVAVGRT